MVQEINGPSIQGAAGFGQKQLILCIQGHKWSQNDHVSISVVKNIIVVTHDIRLLLHVGEACRLRIQSKFAKNFRTPIQAERHYFGMDTAEEEEIADVKVSTATQTSERDTLPPITENPASFISCTQEALEKYPRSLQIQLITSLCQKYAEKEYDITIPEDFLTLFLKASQHLKSCHRSNIVYGLAKALGTMRSDKSDSRLPAKRMPTRLLKYTIKFFNADNVLDVNQHFNTRYYHPNNRFKVVRQTTDYGSPPCTAILVTSGATFIWDLCGVLSWLVKENYANNVAIHWRYT